ncbi:hypothetical protein [Streptomyces sp. CC210A]|uniref:hypothetical protein n=1 Tax=Streptomyces sp. CC210A TaxID=2898184 RepID=UPI001F1DF5B9|nr:hypothetical protein [Streptomyces sp. CC210A]
MRANRTAPAGDTLLRNLWAAPALFAVAAFTAFNAVGTETAVRVGWACYAAGWLPPLLALAVCAARRERPSVGGAAAGTVLVVLGALFRLNHA